MKTTKIAMLILAIQLGRIRRLRCSDLRRPRGRDGPLPRAQPHVRGLRRLGPMMLPNVATDHRIRFTEDQPKGKETMKVKPEHRCDIDTPVLDL